MNAIRRIAKNTGMLFVSQVISYIFGFFYIIYIARYLGPDGFGVLSFALSFTGIFGVVTDLGLDTLTIREVARNRSLDNQYLGNLISIKMILGVLTFGLIVSTINLLEHDEQTIRIVYILALSVIINSYSKIVYSIFRANEKMEYESFGYVLTNLLILAGTLIVIKANMDIVKFALLTLIANVTVFGYILIICFLKLKVPKPMINWPFWKNSIKNALPFGITGIFISIYYWIDSVMLSWMQGDEVVGLYNSAYRIIITLLLVPMAFNSAIFPSMSRYYLTSMDYFKLIYVKYFKFMSIIGVPIGVGTTLLANRIILLIYGDGYTNSIVALQILVWSSVFIYLSGAFARLLETSNNQMIITKITGICAIENVILNLILIPRFSYVGASISTVITEFTALILMILICSKIGHGLPYINFLYLVKVIISSLLMGLFIIYFMYLNLFVIIVSAAIVYCTILWITKGVETEDINIFKFALRKGVHK